jgi:hypothetical protein
MDQSTLGLLQPTEVLEDNASLIKILMQCDSYQLKNIRSAARRVHQVRGEITAENIQVISVTDEHQPANILTKIVSSATTHWRQVAGVLGKQPAIDQMIALTKEFATARRSQGLEMPAYLTEVLKRIVTTAKKVAHTETKENEIRPVYKFQSDPSSHPSVSARRRDRGGNKYQNIST